MADVLRFDIAKDPKGNPITYGRVGDTDGLTRSVKVFEDGKPLDLTGYVITFEGNTSKYRTKVFDTGGVELVDATKGEFTYTFPNMAFAVEGQYERAYFSFAKSDTRKTTGDFEIIVFGNSDIDADEAETIITEYNRLVAELHALQEQNIAELQELQDEYIASTDQAFADIVGRINSLKSQIDEYEQTVDSKASEVLTTVANALAEFEAGDFYTKAETTDVINQLDWQKYPLTQSDGTAKYFPSITPVPNSLADITETGTWYLTANQFNSLIEETTVPTDLRGGGWLIVLPFTGSADLKTVYQMWLSNTSSEGKNRRPIIRYWAESKGAPSDWVELASTQALNIHISNTSNPHGVTKDQVGLGNVPNYAVATQEEAETGTADDKLMTPLRVFQSIAKWVGDKFVKKTGDESIAGIKDFQSMPTINGVPVALDTGVAYKEVTAPTDTTFNGGTVFFWRTGNIVICSMSIQTKGYVGWKNLVEVPEGFRAQQAAGASTVLGSSSTAGVFGTVYTSGTNLQILTQSGAAAGTYKGTFSWYTAEDFPS